MHINWEEVADQVSRELLAISSKLQPTRTRSGRWRAVILTTSGKRKRVYRTTHLAMRAASRALHEIFLPLDVRSERNDFDTSNECRGDVEQNSE